jgi:phosphoglycolate phosphatase
MQELKLVIFDLDGTVVNAYEAIIRSFNYTMKSLRIKSESKSIIRRAVGWGDENLLRPFVGPQHLKKALLIYRKHHRHALARYSRLFPYAREVLGLLKKRGFQLAIASNRPTRFSWILLRHLKLDKVFDYVLCADRLKYGKPNPNILNKIMDRFHVKPSQTLYVGDMAIDAQCARRAKVKAVIVTTGSSSPSEIKKQRPLRVISSLKELLKVLHLS